MEETGSGLPEDMKTEDTKEGDREIRKEKEEKVKEEEEKPKIPLYVPEHEVDENGNIKTEEKEEDVKVVEEVNEGAKEVNIDEIVPIKEEL